MPIADGLRYEGSLFNVLLCHFAVRRWGPWTRADRYRRDDVSTLLLLSRPPDVGSQDLHNHRVAGGQQMAELILHGVGPGGMRVWCSQYLRMSLFRRSCTSKSMPAGSDSVLMMSAPWTCSLCTDAGMQNHG